MTQLIQMANQYKEFNNYNFKYINEDELQQAINKVRRDRLKIKDKKIWNEFCDRETHKNCVSFDDKTILNHSPIRKSSYYSIDSTIDRINNDDIKQYLFENRNEDKLLLNVDKNKCIDKHKALGYSGVTTFTLTSADADVDKRIKTKAIVEKLNSVIIKTRHILEIIKYHIHDFKIPDIPEEVINVQKKATEFCIRFSRNNLYQIELQYSNLLSMNNLYLIRKSSTNFRKDEALLNIMLKLNQNILQAYLTLQRHMHIIWGYNGIADKLNVLLNFSIKVNNIYNFHKDFVDISLLHPLEDICHEMIDSLRCLLNIKNPIEIIKNNKIRHSANSSRPTTINSLYDTKNKRKSENKVTSGKSTNKRNIHSAMTHNQYYMYHNKECNKTKLYCKICDNDAKKEQKHSTRNIIQDVSRFGSNNSRQGSYHKNCHRRLILSKETSNNIKSIRKHFSKNKDADDEKIINAILQKRTEDKIVLQENDVSPNVQDILNNTGDDNNLSDDDEVPEEDIQIDNIVIDRLSENESNNELKNVKLVIISHKRMDSDPVNDIVNEDFADVELNKLERISDILLDGEISGVTSEIETPLNRFIQKELDDFSKFLYKTKITKNK